nr:hypothetical protein [Tanacetum cinerariifolium]
MSNTFDDLQATGGKENGVNILQSIDNGPYQMGTTKDTLGTANDGGVTFGIDQPCTYNDLDEHEKKRFDADIRAMNIFLQGFHKPVNEIRNIKMTMPNIQLNSKFVNNMTPKWDRGDRIKGTLLEVQVQLGVSSDYYKEKMLLMQAQEIGAVLDEEGLLFLAGEQENTYDADVDDHVLTFNKLENAINHHKIPKKVQQTNILDSDNADMGNSNVIPYEQYVKHNEEFVVPSGASSIQYDDYMLHENSVYVPDDSFTTTFNIYKDQVAIYEQHAKF